MRGAVVGTLMSNLGLEHALRTLGVDFKRTKVGDRYIIEMLKENNWSLGGESSGHIVCLDVTTTGDGIISALHVIEAMVRTGTPLHVLKAGMTKYPQHLINVRLEKSSADILSMATVKEAVRSAEAELGDGGRVLLRPSGTEPLLRVMVEGREDGQVKALAKQIADTVAAAINQAA